jgi:hexosaminidase
MQQRPVLLPVPRQVTWGPGTVAVPAELFVVVTSGQQELLPALRRFQGCVQAKLGVSVQIVASGAGLGTGARVTVNPANAAVGHAQGYTLTVGGGSIEVAASTPEGAAYGLATLAQLLAGAGRQVPEVIISDWPDFPRRGVMLDLSRGKVPTMESLYRFVDRLADLKINEFQLYTEHTFAYQDHKEVWQHYSPMTGEEILLLDRYCKERFIDLVPNQNSFGHLTPWLIHDRYKHLAEAPNGFELPWGGRNEEPFSLCPEEPDTIPFLADLYDELLPHFSSQLFNVGCDETWDVGQGRSKEAVADRGEHRVYLDQLLRIYELAKARGKTMQFWGDIIVKAPELIAELPKGIVALEWGYEANHPFDERCGHFAKAGVPFYVCPGTSTWNSLVGRTTNALGNLRSAAESGLKHGAIGYLNTIWGDRGHQDYEPVYYLPVAYGAGVSWACEANREADLRPYLNQLFGDRAGRIGDVLYDLGDSYLAAGILPPNGTALAYMFHFALNRPLRAAMASGIDTDAQEKAVREAAAGLDQVELTSPEGALVLRELRNSVRLLLHLCQFARLRSAMGEDEAYQPDKAQVRALLQDLDAIVAEHRILWLERNRVGGLAEMSLPPFQAIQAEYKRLLA